MEDAEYFSIVEGTHAVQNPTSPEKLRLVAEYLGLRRGGRLLDIGSGRGWWTVHAATEGCDVTGLEINEHFAAAARRRAAEAGVTDRHRIVLGPAAEFAAEPDGYDFATCLGASFALDGYRPTLEHLARAVRPGGRIAVGELHTADGSTSPELPSLPELAHVAAEFDLDVVGIVSANTDDWDRYESRQWLNAREWFDGNPDHPRRHEVLATSRAHRESYLRDERGQLGWSVLIAVVNRGG